SRYLLRLFLCAAVSFRCEAKQRCSDTTRRWSHAVEHPPAVVGDKDLVDGADANGRSHVV
ncbi:MAG TPA: hypothetical protein VNF99_08660, partial [Stellaceae bacterium]|nr:hypothetical protein [Stellaceae bacterium]